MAIAAFIVSVGGIEYENGLINIEQQVPYGDLFAKLGD